VRKQMNDAELAAWASVLASPLLLAPWKALEVSGEARRDAQLAARRAYNAKLLLPDTAGVSSSALDRFHASIGFHGAFSSERGESVFCVTESVVVLSLPRSSLVSTAPPDVLGGERVLVVVGDSSRALGEQDYSWSNRDEDFLHQLSVAILPPGAFKFAPLLSLSYTTRNKENENEFGWETNSWGVTVDKGTSDVLEE